MNMTILHDRRFLIDARSAPAQHLFNQGSPAHVAAPFLRQRIIIDCPAVRPLQYGVTRGRFRMFHHLLRRLTAAPGTDAHMHHIVSVEHFALGQRIDGFQQLAGDTLGLL